MAFAPVTGVSESFNPSFAELECKLVFLEPSERNLVNEAYRACEEFVKCLGSSSFHGYHQDHTLPSLFLSHCCPAKIGAKYSTFSLYKPALHALFQEPHEGIVMKECSSMQRIVRCMCAELLQLVPPEVFLLKLPALDDASTFAYIFFHVLKPSRLDFSDIVLEHMLSDTDPTEESLALCNSSRLLVFTRTSSLLQKLHSSPEEVFGNAMSSGLVIKQVVDHDTRKDIERAVVKFEDSHKPCCVIHASYLQAEQLNIWLRCIGETCRQKASDIRQSYILILQQPPGLDTYCQPPLSASFCNNWNCLFMDEIVQPVIKLSSFSEMFAEETGGYASCRSPCQWPHILANILQDNERCSFTQTSAVDVFVANLRGQVPLPRTSEEVVEPVERFYAIGPQDGRLQALQIVLCDHLVIWEFIEERFLSVLSGRTAYELVREVAAAIVDRKIGGSFATEVDSRLQHIWYAISGHVLWAVCDGFGLAALPKWDSDTLKLLLDTVPELDMGLVQPEMYWHLVRTKRIILPHIPLFFFLSDKVTLYLKNVQSSNVQTVDRYIKGDECLSSLLECSQSEPLQIAYCTDRLLLALTKSCRTLKVDCPERIAVRIVVRWLQCHSSAAACTQPPCLLAVLHWAQLHRMPTMKALFRIAAAVSSMALCEENTGELDALPASGPGEFVENYTVFVVVNLWHGLLNLCSVSLTDWAEKLGKWISAVEDFIKVSKWEEVTMSACNLLSRDFKLKVSIMSSLCRLLRNVAHTLGSSLVLLAEDILELARSCTVLISIIRQVTSLMSGVQPAAAGYLMFALLDVVLCCVSSDCVDRDSLHAVLQLVNGELCAINMQRYRQISVQVLQALHAKPIHNPQAALTLDSGLSKVLSAEACYISRVHPDHDPASSPLAHVLFEYECQCLGKNQCQISDRLAELRTGDGNSGEETLMQSVKRAAIKHAIVDLFIESGCQLEDATSLENESHRLFSVLTGMPDTHFNLSPPGAYSQYVLKGLFTKLERSKVLHFLKSSAIGWCTLAARQLEVTAVEESAGLSFMRSGREAQENGFEEASQVYKELSRLVHQGKSDAFSALCGWCDDKKRCGLKVDDLRPNAWLKGMLMLVIYYEYFRQNEIADIQPLSVIFNTQLNWTELEKNAFLFFLSDSYRHSASGQYCYLFDAASKDQRDIALRDTLVNFLVCCLFFKPMTHHHWTTLLSQPERILHTLYFAATSYSGRISGPVGIDCCTMFLESGKHVGSVHVGSCLSQRSVQISTFFTYAALFWHTLLEDETKPARVLTCVYVQHEGTELSTYRDKVMQFCFVRLNAMFHHIRTGCKQPSTYQSCAHYLTRCLEKLAQCQIRRRGVFLSTYDLKADESRIFAENVFQRDIVDSSFQFDQVPLAANLEQSSCLENSLQLYALRPSYLAGFSYMAEKFAGRRECHGNVSLLQYVIEHEEDLKHISLAPSILTAVMWLRNNCSNRRYLCTVAVRDLIKMPGAGDLVTGMEAFNELISRNDGQIRAGACGVTSAVCPLSNDSVLEYTSNCLSAAAAVLVESHSKFFSAFQVVRDELGPSNSELEQQLHVLFHASSLHPAADWSLEILDCSRGDGLLNAGNLELLVQQCGFESCENGQEQQTAGVEFEWLHLQLILVSAITENAFNLTFPSRWHEDLDYALCEDDHALGC